MASRSASNKLKYRSLITVTLQNAILGLSMRHVRTRPSDMFLSSTAVVIAEEVKLLTSLVLVFMEEGKNVHRLKATLHNTIVKQPIDTLKMCAPSFLYILQNNLLYVSASHLYVATYQVTYQLKIMTTAVFAVIILRKQLFPTQWNALVSLVIEVATVQLAQTDCSGTAASRQQQPGETDAEHPAQFAESALRHVNLLRK